jgi:uncharacterized protein
VVDWNRLKQALEDQFALDLRSVHGPMHWKSVEKIGCELAEITQADLTVVRLFAWFHDACRQSENDDPLHGERAAALLSSYRGKLFDIPDSAFRTLKVACARHADGLTSADPIVGTCWDSDRLDLPRVGIQPSPELMSTIEGKRRVLELFERR